MAAPTAPPPRGARPVEVVPVVPGPAGVRDLVGRLATALGGNGPALGVVPDGRTDYTAAARAAVTGDGSSVPLDVAVVLPTSGSTGDPRGVLLTAHGLRASADATHEVLGGPGAWLLALPVTAVGGLQVLVRGMLAGTPTTVLGSVGGAAPFDPAAFAAAAQKVPGGRRYTSLVPTQAARVVAAGLVGSLTGFDAVLLGGARTPARLLAELRAAGVRAVTTYGMTESSGGAVYDGRPLPGVHVSVADPDPTGVGRLVLSGAVVAAGYRSRPDADLADGRFVTRDLGRVEEDGRVQVLGRVDDVVQVGGVNVSVDAVEDVLQTELREVAVVAVPDPEWGQVLVAFLAADADDDELAELVAAALGRSAVPRRWYHVDQLPLLPGGKPDRPALRAAAAS